MQPAASEISTCPSCGRTLEETSDGGRGCMFCLLRVGIGGEDNVSQPAASGSTSKPFEDEERFGVYEIEHRDDGSLYELGHGAMGVTYRAIDTTLQRRVALKVIRLAIAGRSAEARERFLREARAAAALRHEHIATIFQFGIREDTGQCFYAMELIEGETLEECVHRAGPLNIRTTIEIAQQATSALAVAEKRGVIHRDLKPANLMLVNADDTEVSMASRERRTRRRRIPQLRNNPGVPIVKIIDFGLAKALNAPVDPMSLTQDGFVGTPAFASPEQFENSALDVRSDVYSLGVTLWFALTGKTPFAGHTVEEIRRAQQASALPMEQLKAAHVPFRLRWLLQSMLALEPAARPRTHDLRAKLQGCPAASQCVSPMRTTLASTFTRLLHPFRTQIPASAPVVRDKSIAVIPFENLSSDPNNAFFADGIQEEILGRLSKIADLKVISRTSTQRYKRKRDSLREIAERLGVANILEGSVQKSANQVRINVQLIDAASDTHLWAETYDRELTDIFAVETDIAKTIAGTLRAKLSGVEQSAIARRPTKESQAHDFYLKARYFLGKRSNESLKLAIDYFNRAIAKDPNYALAYAGLADSYALLPGYSDEPTAKVLPKARAAAEKAISLDNTLPDAHVALGLVLQIVDFNLKNAKHRFQRAIELNPNSATAHYFLAYRVLTPLGQFDQAIIELKRAVELDPFSVVMNANFGYCYLLARRYFEAISQLRKTVELDPNFSYTRVVLGGALLFSGDSAGAIREFVKAYELERTYESGARRFGLPALAYGYAMQGKREKALRLLAQLQEVDEKQGSVHYAYGFAVIHLALGNRKEAIDWLERSYQAREISIIFNIKVDPVLDSLRGDPRFERLTNQIVPPDSY
jgi:eukaryotic-like serine/threonine-protein kinase